MTVRNHLALLAPFAIVGGLGGFFHFGAGRPMCYAQAQCPRRDRTDGTTDRRPAEHFRQITFEELDWERDGYSRFTKDDLPPAVAALYGSKVRIAGFVRPIELEFSMKRFVLRRHWIISCPGEELPAHAEVFVELRAGATLEFATNPMVVSGILGIHDFEWEEGGEKSSMLMISDAEASPLRLAVSVEKERTHAARPLNETSRIRIRPTCEKRRWLRRAVGNRRRRLCRFGADSGRRWAPR